MFLIGRRISTSILEKFFIIFDEVIKPHQLFNAKNGLNTFVCKLFHLRLGRHKLNCPHYFAISGVI